MITFDNIREACFIYRGRVVKGVDGDTFWVKFDWGRKRFDEDTVVRLADFNTPELNSTNPFEVAHAKEARDFVAALLPVGVEVVLQHSKMAFYNRVQATVWFERDGEWYSLRDVLAANGMAKRTEY